MEACVIFMMRYGSYVLFLLCLGVGFYLVGMPSPVLYALGGDPSHGTPLDVYNNSVYSGRPLESSTFIQRIGNILSSPSTIGSLVLILVATAALSGFSSMYFIPVVILLIITNYVALPWGQYFTTCNTSTDADYYNATYSMTTATAYYQNALECQTYEVPYYTPLLLFMNIMTVMAAISFIRGGV